MSRSAAALIGIASAAGLLAAGCSSSTSAGCGGAICPSATFDLHALDDTTVTWSIGGAPSQTTTGLVPSPPSGYDCSFRYTKGLIRAAISGGAGTVYTGYFDLFCSNGTYGGLEFSAWDLGDYRNWQTGSWQMLAPAGNFDVVFPTAKTGTGCYLDGMQLTVTVDTATGGPAPYPKLVTDDYVRTFRLDFDTSTATPSDRSGNPCTFPDVAQVSLHLTQTAADYVADPNMPCGCQ